MTRIQRRRRRRSTIGGSVLLLAAAIVTCSTVLVSGGFAATGAPSNTSPPTVKGKLVVSETLQADPGTWSGTTPITYAYQWQRCASGGGSCVDIGSATKQSFALTAADVDHSIRVQVTATNADGKGTASSSTTSAVGAAAQAPSNAVRPSIKGTATVGQTLSADTGTWSGATPITYSYQWLRCDKPGNTCGPIGGATKSSYKLTTTDEGHALRVIVGAKNSAGSTNATSLATAPVAASGSSGSSASVGGNGCPAGAKGTLAVSSLAPPARLSVDRMQFSPGVLTRSTRQFVARFHIGACGASVQGALVYATAVPYNQFNVPAEATTDSSGWATITFNRMSGYPASPRQQLLAMFVRARKPGENVLAGISTRRLVSTHVDLAQ